MCPLEEIWPRADLSKDVGYCGKCLSVWESSLSSLQSSNRASHRYVLLVIEPLERRHRDALRHAR